MSNTTDDEQPHPDTRCDRPNDGPRTEKISLRSPTDLVSVIPYLIGFRPSDGDVAVVFTHQGLQACVTVARITDPAQLSDMWTTTVAKVTRSAPDIDAAYLVAYLSRDADTALQDLAARANPPLRYVFRVQSGRMWSLGHRPPDIQDPPEGTVLPTSVPQFAAAFAVAGTADPPDRSGLSDCLKPGPPALLTQAATYLEALTAADRHVSSDDSKPSSPGGSSFWTANTRPAPTVR